MLRVPSNSCVRYLLTCMSTDTNNNRRTGMLSSILQNSTAHSTRTAAVRKSSEVMATFGIRGMSQQLGIKVCCCRICTCINFGFLLSRAGLLKVLQMGMAALCEGLLIRYGVPYADSIGQALTSFLTTTAYCFTTTGILLFCYCFSEKSYSLIRQSLFETLFNGIACCMYFSSSSYMGFISLVWLSPQFHLRPGFWAYPAMTATYYMGFAAGILHGIDAILAFKHFRGYR